MRQATFFIEQVKYPDGFVRHLSMNPIYFLKWAEQTNKKFGIETIAIFKIYPKIKPAIAHFDNDLNAVIIE